LAEKDVNLRIAILLRGVLEQDGMTVILTRDGDRQAITGTQTPLPAGYSAIRADLQERVDLANRARADVFISIHNNGSPDPKQSGTEVWYDGQRPFAAFNRTLAEQTLAALVESIRAVGYPVVNRGLKEDSQFRIFRGQAFPIFVLGPPRTGAMVTRATQMPGILGETLFLTNPTEAELLRREDILSAIVWGYREGLRRYFRLIDQGVLTLPAEGLPTESPKSYTVIPPTLGGGERPGQGLP